LRIHRTAASLAAILTVGFAFTAQAHVSSSNQAAETPLVLAHHGSHDPDWTPVIAHHGSCHPSGCPTVIAHHGSHEPKPKPKFQVVSR